jgi:hypothetical protein
MNERREDHAHTPATALGDAMLSAFETETARQNVTDARAIALVTLDGKAGIALSGYGDDELTGIRAVNDLILQVRAILRTMGKDLHVIEVPRTVPGARS